MLFMRRHKMTKRQLILEDGTVFTGEAFGASSSRDGEVIFYNGVTGYQEIITDPNYKAQIVVMTYPTIGNYGINRDDSEALTPFINGLIVSEVSDAPSNFRNGETLAAFLNKHDIPGISGVDTRKLTRILREKGTMKGIITDVVEDTDAMIEDLKNMHTLVSPVEETSITRPYIVPGRGLRIVLIDMGMKYSLLRELTERNCHVTVVPHNYSTEEILNASPDGVLLSNGPGNPAVLTETIETIKDLLGKVPLFGVGLGHQLFAIASGAKTEKLKVGVFGTGYPVKDLTTEQAWLTTQSRHYTVEKASLNGTDLTETFTSLNDGTVEGLAHNTHDAFSVQFNPEGAPGQSETSFIFDDFLNMIKANQQKNGVDYNAKKYEN